MAVEPGHEPAEGCANAVAGNAVHRGRDERPDVYALNRGGQVHGEEARSSQTAIGTLASRELRNVTSVYFARRGQDSASPASGHGRWTRTVSPGSSAPLSADALIRD